MKLQKASRCFGVMLIFALIAWVLLISLPKEKHHLAITHNFGIGFDLSPSYATVAVSYPNGSIQQIARVDGDRAYREMMLRLSLPTSQHLHKPYRNLGDSISDIPRQIWRDTRKKMGLPSSKDVGTLSNMIYALRARATCYVGEPVSAAAISIPHLTALYGDDLRDAFEYLSLFYLEFFPFSNFHPLPASIASYAGNGLGLCEDYRDDAACAEEELNIPSQFALTVGYTHTSLTTSQAHVSSAYYIEATPTLENLRLEYDTRHEESYWETVRHMLQSPVIDSPVSRNISMVLLFGDATEVPRFRGVLGAVINEVLGGQVQIVDQQPEFSASKGVAELAKRAIFRQGWIQDVSSEL
ncbi:hypothetical protein F5B22DRAFT_630116 [Xylaria bambusicola]|uniref:uncharacterized protein n=1 Tax=Xylaria bambusicola TaxID=326684 RepID=UPI002007C520|nr:uncharacterized protein F5B22DRAFT_630116 [Xylaria bambusicola]KAI0503210.1 hypothetical protein F5B22DRAFT_630116 [Xylaria bambusicola]